MPYNTRRKSLSLPSLGIQLPSASRAHRPSPTKTSVAVEAQQPPIKKIKRSHHANSSSPGSPTTPRPRSSTTSSSSSKNVSFADRPKSSGRAAYEHTPPPSPGAAADTRIDTDGINDDIVIGVIEQLEKTGNRPHLIKELAAVLSTTNDAVSASANPAALLSSRLSTYLRRPAWSALSPCPLGKETIPVHPRKVFYYLTASARQDLPTDSSDILSSISMNTIGGGGKGGKRIISPSLSNASIDEDMEGAEDRRRDALSPSPEIDLSTPELDNMAPGREDNFPTPMTPGGSSFSGRSSLARDGSNGGSSENINLVHNHRAASPPLEGDEKEFTQTASSMRMRGMSLDDLNIRQSNEVEITVFEDLSEMQVEETEEEKAKHNREAAAALFGGHHQHAQETATGVMSSPMVKPINETILGDARKAEGEVEMEGSDSILGTQGLGSSWEIQKPESVDLDELDDLLGEF